MTSLVRRTTGRLVAAVLVTAAAGTAALVPSAPASAATCSSASGVSVVVDFGSLGGGVQSGCVSDGAGQSAASVFSSAGVALTRVSGMAGFVCRVQGLPSPEVEGCNDTPPDDAYWGLWWSDGTSGSWVYSNYGVDGLKVPNGAYIGFAWQGSGSKRVPGLTPAPHQAAAPQPTAPTSGPTSKPTSKPTSQADQQAHVEAVEQADEEAQRHAVLEARPARRRRLRRRRPTSARADRERLGRGDAHGATDGLARSSVRRPSAASASAVPTTSASVPSPTVSTDGETSAPIAPVSDAAAPEQSSALPAWVVPLVLLVLAGGGLAAYLVRRRSRPSP